MTEARISKRLPTAPVALGGADELSSKVGSMVDDTTLLKFALLVELGVEPARAAISASSGRPACAVVEWLARALSSRPDPSANLDAAAEDAE